MPWRGKARTGEIEGDGNLAERQGRLRESGGSGGNGSPCWSCTPTGPHESKGLKGGRK